MLEICLLWRRLLLAANTVRKPFHCKEPHRPCPCRLRRPPCFFMQKYLSSVVVTVRSIDNFIKVNTSPFFSLVQVRIDFSFHESVVHTCSLVNPAVVLLKYILPTLRLSMIKLFFVLFFFCCQNLHLTSRASMCLIRPTSQPKCHLSIYSIDPFLTKAQVPVKAFTTAPLDSYGSELAELPASSLLSTMQITQNVVNVWI